MSTRCCRQDVISHFAPSLKLGAIEAGKHSNAVSYSAATLRCHSSKQLASDSSFFESSLEYSGFKYSGFEHHCPTRVLRRRHTLLNALAARAICLGWLMDTNSMSHWRPEDPTFEMIGVVSPVHSPQAVSRAIRRRRSGLADGRIFIIPTRAKHILRQAMLCLR